MAKSNKNQPHTISDKNIHIRKARTASVMSGVRASASGSVNSNRKRGSRPSRKSQAAGLTTGGEASGLGKRGNSLRGGVAKGATVSPAAARIELHADQRRAASLYWSAFNKQQQDYQDLLAAGVEVEPPEKLKGRGVTMCGWTQIAGQETLLMRQRGPDGRIRAYFTGRQRCGLRNGCPVCTAKNAQEDRQAVNDGLAAARAMDGVFPVMLTLTLRHERSDSAADLIDALARAEQGIKDKGAWKRLAKKLAGYARVLEWTFGEENGFHPHYHTILLVKAASEDEAIAKVFEVQPLYMNELGKAGADGTSKAAWKHSFQVQGAGAVRNYITKWGSAEELTGALAKSGDGENLTFWQLLRMARIADDERDRQRYGAIWWEIFLATSGRHQLYKNARWNALVKAWRAENPAHDEPAEPEQVANFGVREKRELPTRAWVKARHKVLSLYGAAEAHADLEAAKAAVQHELDHGQTDDEILDALDAERGEELIEVDCIRRGGDEEGRASETEGGDPEQRAPWGLYRGLRGGGQGDFPGGDWSAGLGLRSSGGSLRGAAGDG